jgi:3-hydroxymyristoyl/3-hydroxydecanoyl-(acyl carrier protein) dehydratase
MIEPQKVFSTIRTGAVSQWTLPPDLPYFDGHFPGMPMFPAVGIIDASIYCLQNFTGRKADMAQAVTNAKFLNPIIPGQTVEIEVNGTAPDFQVQWRDPGTAKELANLKIKF